MWLAAGKSRVLVALVVAESLQTLCVALVVVESRQILCVEDVKVVRPALMPAVELEREKAF